MIRCLAHRDDNTFPYQVNRARHYRVILVANLSAIVRHGPFCSAYVVVPPSFPVKPGLAARHGSFLGHIAFPFEERGALAKRSASSEAFRGRQPTQNRIIVMLEEIGKYRAYVSTLRKKAKKQIRSEELRGEFRPDLVMEPALGVKRTSSKVVEVEATVNNHTISKSLFSLLYYMARHARVKGYLVVPSSGYRFALDRVVAVKEVIRRFRRGGKGKRRTVPIVVLTFDQVRRYHTELLRHVHQPTGRRGRLPKFKGFDD